MSVIRERLVRTLSPNWRRYVRTRRRLAERHLRGSGIEIGALHMPLPVPNGASVRYVDHRTGDELRAGHPELAHHDIADPDVVDDGARLTSIPDESVDFVVANHFLEHTEDPLGALEAHARVLRDGGVLYLALPVRGQGVDRRRDPVGPDHLVRDHAKGPAWSRRSHYEEWVRAVDAPAETAVAGAAAALDEQDFSIHFHAWTEEEFADLLRRGAELGLPLQLEEIVPNFHEFIVIARKRAAA